MTSPPGATGFWADAAPGWARDEARIELIGGELGRLAMDQLNLGPGLQVLDIGCGTGSTTIELAERAAPGGHVVGVDASPAMLAIARRRITAHPVELVEGDAQRIELAPSSTDRIFSRFGVMFFDRPVAAFANLRGALSGTGRLAVVVWQAIDRNGWMAEPAAAASEALGIEISLPAPGQPGPFAFADPERLRATLVDAGYRHVDVASYNDHVQLPISGAMAYAAGGMAHGGIRQALRETGVEPVGEREVERAIGRRLLRHADRGRIHLSRGAHIAVATR